MMIVPFAPEDADGVEFANRCKSEFLSEALLGLAMV